MNREKRNSVVIIKSKEHLEDQGVSGSILKWTLKEAGWEVWNVFFWIRIRTCCGMFRIW